MKRKMKFGLMPAMFLLLAAAGISGESAISWVFIAVAGGIALLLFIEALKKS